MSETLFLRSNTTERREKYVPYRFKRRSIVAHFTVNPDFLTSLPFLHFDKILHFSTKFDKFQNSAPNRILFMIK